MIFTHNIFLFVVNREILESILRGALKEKILLYSKNTRLSIPTYLPYNDWQNIKKKKKKYIYISFLCRNWYFYWFLNYHMLEYPFMCRLRECGKLHQQFPWKALIKLMRSSPFRGSLYLQVVIRWRYIRDRDVLANRR